MTKFRKEWEYLLIRNQKYFSNCSSGQWVTKLILWIRILVGNWHLDQDIWLDFVLLHCPLMGWEVVVVGDMMYILEKDLRYIRNQPCKKKISSFRKYPAFVDRDSFLLFQNWPIIQKASWEKPSSSWKWQELLGWTGNFRPEVPGLTKKSENRYVTGYQEDENSTNWVPNREVVMYRVYVRVKYPHARARGLAQSTYSNIKKLCPWLSHAHSLRAWQ